MSPVKVQDVVTRNATEVVLPPLGNRPKQRFGLHPWLSKYPGNMSPHLVHAGAHALGEVVVVVGRRVCAALEGGVVHDAVDLVGGHTRPDGGVRRVQDLPPRSACGAEPRQVLSGRVHRHCGGGRHMVLVVPVEGATGSDMSSADLGDSRVSESVIGSRGAIVPWAGQGEASRCNTQDCGASALQSPACLLALCRVRQPAIHQERKSCPTSSAIILENMTPWHADSMSDHSMWGHYILGMIGRRLSQRRGFMEACTKARSYSSLI
jgi:hypothetical protein